MADFRTILVSTDLSDRSLYAVPVARSLAKQLGARVVFLYVVEQAHVIASPIAFEGDQLTPVENGRHHALLERLRELLPEEPGVKVDYIVRDGGACDEILKVADETQCDLIVMSTHGRTGLDRLVMGSVADAVMRRATCPVLTVRQSARADKQRKSPSTGSTNA